MQTLAAMLDSVITAGSTGRDRREGLTQSLAKELAAVGEVLATRRVLVVSIFNRSAPIPSVFAATLRILALTP